MIYFRMKLTAALLVLLFSVMACIAPGMQRQGEAPQANQAPLDILLKGLDRVNDGIQSAAKVSSEIAMAKPRYDEAVAQAKAQADVNHNGQVDSWEKPLYASTLASLLSTMGLSLLRSSSRKKEVDELHARIDDVEAPKKAA